MVMKLPSLAEGMPQCKLTVLNGGFYRASGSHLMRTFERTPIWGPALFFLIQHPVHGEILFDTGYSTRFFNVTRKFPFRLMRYVTPVRINEQENAVNQLLSRAIDPDRVTVILSHMHVDHVGGLHDFPNSRIIVNKKEWEFTRRSTISLFRNFYIKSLFDQLDPALVDLVDFEQGVPYGPFHRSIDLYQDGTLILVPLPGHSIGQMGLIVNISSKEKYFLISDAAYVRANYRTNLAGAGPSRFAHYDYSSYRQHFPVLRELEQRNEGLILLPSHDPEIYETYAEPLRDSYYGE